MKTVNVHQAKTHLSKLLEEVASGEEIILARSGKPVAKLVKYEERPVRTPGVWKKKVHAGSEFDEVPDEVHRAMNLGEDVAN